jgi:hypothetical protein
MALLYFTKVSTCSSMAEVFAEASHDCLTRTQAGDVLVFVGKLLSKSAQAQLTAHYADVRNLCWKHRDECGVKGG